MGSTNAIDVKASIVTLIRNLPEATSEKWDLDWGFSRNPRTTWVYCGEINWDSSEWVTNRQREEIFRVKVVFNIKRRRMSPEDAERDVTRIAKLVEDAVKASPNFGDGAVVTSSFIPKRMDSWPTDDMTEAQLEADIRITARF